MTQQQLLTGWGRTAPSAACVLPAPGDDELAERVRTCGPRGVLARGLGRSYGDAAQNAGGLVVDMTGRAAILAVDLAAATVQVEGGASLDDLMRRLLPLGLFVPVSPGTRQVTVGGAIAADVHGKNHHREGSFGRHVRSLDLLVADGTVRTLGPDDELFWATVGGMGLTGVVLRAVVAMKRVETAYCVVDTERAADLDDLMALMVEGDRRYTYSVAWIDTLARGRSLGRSVLSRGESATVAQLPPRLASQPLRFDPRARLAAPRAVPPGLLNRASVRAFNEVWYRKAPRRRTGEIVGIAPFFHPLDGVADWNRVYGPRGFLQHQLVVPDEAAPAMRRCVELVAGAARGSFLAVLKRFGPAGRGHLSFPLAGWTLAVDVPLGVAAATSRVETLLSRLDIEVAEAGGRVYLAKDARLRAASVAAMYPRLSRWRQVRASVDPDGVFVSDQARRLGL